MEICDFMSWQGPVRNIISFSLFKTIDRYNSAMNFLQTVTVGEKPSGVQRWILRKTQSLNSGDVVKRAARHGDCGGLCALWYSLKQDLLIKKHCGYKLLVLMCMQCVCLSLCLPGVRTISLVTRRLSPLSLLKLTSHWVHWHPCHIPSTPSKHLLSLSLSHTHTLTHTLHEYLIRTGLMTCSIRPVQKHPMWAPLRLIINSPECRRDTPSHTYKYTMKG